MTGKSTGREMRNDAEHYMIIRWAGSIRMAKESTESDRRGKTADVITRWKGRESSAVNKKTYVKVIRKGGWVRKQKGIIKGGWTRKQKVKDQRNCDNHRNINVLRKTRGKMSSNWNQEASSIFKSRFCTFLAPSSLGIRWLTYSSVLVRLQAFSSPITAFHLSSLLYLWTCATLSFSIVASFMSK